MIEYQYDNYFAPDYNPFRSISLWNYETFQRTTPDDIEALVLSIRKLAKTHGEQFVVAVPTRYLKNDRMDYTSLPRSSKIVLMADAVISYEKNDIEPSGYKITKIKSRHDNRFDEHLKFSFLKEAYRHNFD